MGFGLAMLADTAATTTDLQSAFGSAITKVQGDCMGMIGTALPVCLAIVGAVVAITFGVKFFKKSAKG